jgi:hypothetical protein
MFTFFCVEERKEKICLLSLYSLTPLAFQTKAAIMSRPHLHKATLTLCNHLQKASSSSSWFFTAITMQSISQVVLGFLRVFDNTHQKVKRTIYTLRTFLKQAQRRIISA